MRDRFALAVFGVALVAVPIYVFFTDDTAPTYDALRSFVLVQASAVFCLTSYTMGWVVVRMRKARKAGTSIVPDPGARAVILGSMARNLGILILLFGGALNLVGRLNNTHLDYRTPLFQLAMLLLFYGWALIDRRVYRTTKTPQELVGGIVVEKAVEEARRMTDEMGVSASAQAFQDAREKRGQIGP